MMIFRFSMNCPGQALPIALSLLNDGVEEFDSVRREQQIVSLEDLAASLEAEWQNIYGAPSGMEPRVLTWYSEWSAQFATEEAIKRALQFGGAFDKPAVKRMREHVIECNPCETSYWQFVLLAANRDRSILTDDVSYQLSEIGRHEQGQPSRSFEEYLQSTSIQQRLTQAVFSVNRSLLNLRPPARA